MAEKCSSTPDEKKSMVELEKEAKRRINAQKRLIALATKVFEDDPQAAEKWFRSKQPKLCGAKPIDHINTVKGAKEVRALLMRMEYGVYA